MGANTASQWPPKKTLKTSEDSKDRKLKDRKLKDSEAKEFKEEDSVVSTETLKKIYEKLAWEHTKGT